jgi:hypothetical protein
LDYKPYIVLAYIIETLNLAHIVIKRCLINTPKFVFILLFLKNKKGKETASLNANSLLWMAYCKNALSKQRALDNALSRAL